MSEKPPAPAPSVSTQPPSDPPSSGAPAPAAAAPFYEGFQDAELKGNLRLQRLGSVEEMARSLINAEKRLGVPEDQLIRMPSDPKDDKAMRAIYTKLGLPDKADGYGIQLDAKASDADKAVLGDFLKTAHDAGLPQSMAQKMVAWWQGEGAKFQQQQTAQAEEARVAGETELKTAWGQQFDLKSKEIGRLARDLGGPELGAELDAGKLGSHPQLAKMLGAMVDKMAEPGGIPRGDTASLSGQMTPAQAKAALVTLQADTIKSRALMERNNPLHAAVLKERNALLAMADGREPS